MKPLSPAAVVLGERLAQPGAIAQPLDLLRRDPRLGQHLLRQQPRQPARVEPVRLRAPPPAEQRTRLHRLRQPHLEAVRDSSRQTQRQPVVASIATAASRPRHSSAQRARLSRSAEKRASTTSPPSGSSTAAWKACLWMSIAAYNITHLLSLTEARSSSALRTEPYDIHAKGQRTSAWYWAKLAKRPLRAAADHCVPSETLWPGSPGSPGSRQGRGQLGFKSGLVPSVSNVLRWLRPWVSGTNPRVWMDVVVALPRDGGAAQGTSRRANTRLDLMEEGPSAIRARADAAPGRIAKEQWRLPQLVDTTYNAESLLGDAGTRAVRPRRVRCSGAGAARRCRSHPGGVRRGRRCVRRRPRSPDDAARPGGLGSGVSRPAQCIPRCGAGALCNSACTRRASQTLLSAVRSVDRRTSLSSAV